MFIIWITWEGHAIIKNESLKFQNNLDTLTESGVNAKCQSRILVFEVSVDWRRTGPAYPITIRVLEVFAPSCNLRHFLLKYLHNMVYIFVCVLKRNKQDIRNDQSIFDTSCELLLLVIAYTLASQQMASKYQTIHSRGWVKPSLCHGTLLSISKLWKPFIGSGLIWLRD